jgi:hypothetical protein
MRKITVRTEELADIPALERKHKAKLLQAHILGEEAIAEMLPVASLEFFIDVWNCQGTLVLVDGEQETWVTKDEWQYDQELYGELVERVVYDDNDGAINMSGRYYAQTEESEGLFHKLLAQMQKRQKEKAVVYLIPLEQAGRFVEIPPKFCAEAYENKNPDFEEHGPAAWATAEALEGLKAIGVESTILAEAETLPVFHGLSTYIDTCDYEDALTAICLASLFGPYIRGVSYVGYNCERDVAEELVWNKDRFFYYTRKQGRDFIWRVIMDEDDAAWCTSLWRHDENFMAWLEELGLELDEG